jgi:cytochrome b561
MNALNTETNAHRFTNTAVALHWLAALLIFAAFPLGLYMADLDLSPTKLKLFSYHKWIGITVLLLSILRVLWLRWHPAPPLPGSMPAWQQRAAHGLQHLLYLLLFAIPITGWLMSSAKGFQVVYLGVLPLPDLVGKNKELGELLEGIHEALNWLLLSLFVLHVAAALKHHFVERDDILIRMAPWLARKTRS